MSLFVLRGLLTSTDAWEAFTYHCLAVIEPHLGGMSKVDYSALGTEATATFRMLMAVEPLDGIFVSLCHGTADALHMPAAARYITTDDAHLFRDKFCYLVSCSSGKELGPEAVKRGARGFIGFSDKIWFMPLTREDEQREVLMSGLVAYLQGEPYPKAAQVLKKAMRDLAHKLSVARSNPLRDAPVIGHLLMNEKLVRYGP
jgi:hypothetical protein